MKYTREETIAMMDKALEMLKNNPHCDVSDEELQRRRDSMMDERSLETLSMLLTIASDEEEREQKKKAKHKKK